MGKREASGAAILDKLEDLAKAIEAPPAPTLEEMLTTMQNAAGDPAALDCDTGSPVRIKRPVRHAQIRGAVVSQNGMQSESPVPER